MRSLRSRLVVGIIGGIILLLTVFSIVIYAVIRRVLVNQFDASLTATSWILAASVEYDVNEIELELDPQMMPEFQSPGQSAYYQFWQHDGTMAAKSPSLGTDDLLQFQGSLDMPVFKTLQTRNGRPGRAVGLKFKPRTGGSYDEQQMAKQQTLTLVVARDAGDLYYHLRFLRWLLVIASAGTISLSFLVAAFVARRGLSPLNSLAARIAAVKEDDLTDRIAAEDMPAEVVPIRNRLNDLLSRLEKSFNRERRFTADIAHELRTPLAGIRSTLEVTLAHKRDVNEYQSSLSDCLAISKDMQAMMDNLLALARIDNHQMTFQRAPIQLAELANSCWQAFSIKARKRGIVFENRIPAETTCQTDRESLSMVLSNLFDNAVEYTNERGQIWITGSLTGNSVEITVANTGCRLTKEQAAQIFDRFWRGDSSRTNTGVHCGLGLALVQRIIDALGGSTSVEAQPGGIFTIRVIAPA